MSKKSTKSVKPAAPQVKPVKASVAPAKLEVAKPVKKTLAPPKKAPEAPKAIPVALPSVKMPVAAASVPAPVGSTVMAQIDIGFGNLLFVRGEGAGLSWTSGVAMDCAADDQWKITLPPSKDPVVFKLLINDLTWSNGENYQAAPGETVVVTPSF